MNKITALFYIFLTFSLIVTMVFFSQEKPVPKESYPIDLNQFPPGSVHLSGDRPIILRDGLGIMNNPLETFVMAGGKTQKGDLRPLLVDDDGRVVCAPTSQ